MDAARGRLGRRGDEAYRERAGDGGERGQVGVAMAGQADSQPDAHGAEEESREAREPDCDQRRARSAAASHRRRIRAENGPTASQ